MSSSQQKPISLSHVESAISQEPDNQPSTTTTSTSSSSRLYILIGQTLTILALIGIVIWLAVDPPSSSPGLEGCVELSTYPGYQGDIDLQGKVCLKQSGVGFIYDYHFSGLPDNAQGGWHVHEGTSCQDSGKHFFDGLDVDPWNAIKWNSNLLGIAKDQVDMRFTPLNVLGRTIVVHGPDGTRIACGEIPGQPHQHTKPPTRAPTRLPTGDASCRDSLDFIDVNGNTCRDWIRYNCNIADRYNLLGRRLSNHQKRDLLQNCPASCGVCTPSFPAPVPEGLCVDNEAFKDENEDNCNQWKRYNCFQAAEQYELSFNGQNDLIANCPASCGLCNPLPHPPTNIPEDQCRDSPSTTDDDETPCQNIQGRNCYFAPLLDDDEFTFTQRKDLLTNCPASCALCLQEPPQAVSVDQCVDNEAFTSEDRSYCRDWIGYNCHQAVFEESDISFNGQLDLIANCPASCGLCVPSPPTPPKPRNCQDTHNFRDLNGNKCGYWRGKNCNRISVTEGVSFANQKNILENCPVSCGVCKPPCTRRLGNNSTVSNDSFIAC